MGETLQVSAEVADIPTEALNAALLVYLGSFSFPLFSRCLLSLTLFLTVADVTLPQRGLQALMQDGVGGTGARAGWSEAVQLSKRGTGQDGTQTLSPLQRITEAFFFSNAKGGRTVNETEVKQSQRHI